MPFVEQVCLDLEDCVRRRIQESGRFSLVLSGGSTPRAIYTRMAEWSQQDPDLWRQVDYFWGDERSVPADHPDSNYRMAMEAWLAPAGIPPTHIHRLPGDARDLAQAAREYQSLIASLISERQDGIPVLDLVMLGMGDDGHTASLFPGTEALAVTDRLVAENDVPQLATTRLTMTYPLINHARQVWFLIAGASKADRLAEVLAPAPDLNVTYPCQFVDPVSGQLRWYLDEPAAGCL
jgi:6-phosphogluconolactonase